MTDPTEQLKIITSIKELLSHLEKDGSPKNEGVILEIFDKLTALEYSLTEAIEPM